MITPNAVETTNRREAYYKEIAENYLAPLWERLAAVAPSVPRPGAKPMCWHYEDVRPHVLKAGGLLTTEEAERRVLMLENPGLQGQSRITDSLYAGLQLLLPGEHAGSHRHTAAALRVILEGAGAYTSVNGERTLMERGDFVITPSWSWHDHGNETSEPMIWMDGLDVHIVNLFNTGFFEPHPNHTVPASRAAGDSEVRYSVGGLFPEGAESNRLSTPLLNYRYEKARASLADLYRRGPVDPCHGVRLRYVNPLTGESVMPTLSATIQLLPAGFETAPYQSTESAVFVALEGKGRIEFESQSFEWTGNDIFVVPSWVPHRLIAESESILFSFSDRVAQEKLGIWREKRGNS
jgi:gentisate 1,2-dioxygenase